MGNDNCEILLNTTNPLVCLSLELSKKYHDGQTDKNGIDYYQHPLRVAMSLDNDNEKIVALLHDVIEECNVTLLDLKNEGIPDECIDAIRILTKDNAYYGEYIKHIKESTNSIAIRVKIADIMDNANLTRMKPKELTMEDLVRTTKYMEALKILLGEDDSAFEL